eukprot:gene19581-22265_t
MEHDPLKQLTEFFKSEGYIGKEAVEEAKAELKRRHERELELKQAASAGLQAPGQTASDKDSNKLLIELLKNQEKMMSS